MKFCSYVYNLDYRVGSVSFDWAAPEFLVSVLVPLEDFLNWAKQSLEGTPLDRNNLGEG